MPFGELAVSSLHEEIVQEAVAGDDVYLTIDANLQGRTEDGFRRIF